MATTNLNKYLIFLLALEIVLFPLHKLKKKNSNINPHLGCLVFLHI